MALPFRSGSLSVMAGAFAIGIGASACGDEAPEPLAVEVSDGIDVVATEMAYDPDEIVVLAGPVHITLRNEGTILHDLRIGEEPFLLEANAGEVDTRTEVLEPGFYDIYCSLAGHREAGMEGVLEVRES